MSLIKLQGNPGGTGTVTLASPNTNSDFTLNLPASNGTVLLDGASQSPTFGTVTATTANVSGTTTSGALVVNSNNISAVNSLGFRNRIINGDQRIHQRGGTLSTNNSQGYFVDRMWGFSSVTAATFSQVSGTGLSGFPFAARGQRNSGNTGTGGVYLGQIIESVNMIDLQGQSITVSFWARCGSNYSATSNTLNVYIRTGTAADQGLNQLISGWTGALDQTSSVTLTTSWQYFSRTFSVPSNAQELSVFFAGFNTGTAGANDFFDVTGVQLEAGSVATPFERRPYGTELALCQRYYFKSISESFAVQSSVFTSYMYKVTMRATPTLTVTPTSGTAAVGTADANGFSAVGSTGAAGANITASAEL